MTPEEKRQRRKEQRENRTPEQIEKSKQKSKSYRDKNKEKIAVKAYDYNKDYAKLSYVKEKAKKYNKKRHQMSEVIDYGKKYQKDNGKRMNQNSRYYNEDLRFEVCLTYSKRHSNSDIPCCRCCGENTDVRFLAIDHIQGKKNLPKSEAKLGGDKLILFLRKNNFPDGYQVLCHNCNAAKGFPKNNNECPMKGKPHF